MDRILGQTRAIEQLETALTSGRPHHAYILHGPAGVGKFTTAMALGRLLLCHDPQTDLAGRPGACGVCPSCLLLPEENPASGAHPDLHVVTKELAQFSEDRQVRERKLTSIPVDVLRQAVLEPVQRSSQLGRAKVFVIDEAELLNPAGQNLLLKTLEEPPPNTFLVLVTSSEDRLLVTIRSRCQRVAFVPLPDEAVRAWARQQDTALADDPMREAWLVSFAAGSLGRAELALGHGLFAWAQQVLPSVDQSSRGKPQAGLGQKMAELIDALAKERVERHKGASKEAANRMAAGLMWSMLAQHARARVAALAEQCDRADPGGAEAALEPWLGVIDALGQAQALLSANVNLGLVCDRTAAAIDAALAGAAAPAGR